MSGIGLRLPVSLREVHHSDKACGSDTRDKAPPQSGYSGHRRLVFPHCESKHRTQRRAYHPEANEIEASD